jgi:hypothetical protein
VYPHRWELLGMGGRIKLKERVEWSERMARLGPPEQEAAEATPEPVPAPTYQPGGSEL